MCRNAALSLTGRRVLAVLGCAALLVAAPANHAASAAEPAADWDAAFGRTSGWTGGDAVYSVDLQDGRLLWLMADSWIGDLRDGRHAPGSRMVNNAVGIHTLAHPSRPPRPEELNFHWGPPDTEGHPTAWIVPDGQRIAAARKRQAPTWYWVADGLVAPSPDGGTRLLVFLWQIGRIPEAKGVWSFESVGGTLGVIDDFSGPPDQWRVTQHEIPHFRSERSRSAARPEITWGSAVTLQPGDRGEDSGPWVYVFGTRDIGGWDKQLVLARAQAKAILEFDRWEFRSADRWTRDVDQAAPVAEGLVSEFSVDRVVIRERPLWLLVQSEPLFGDRIFVRTSDRLEGPWSQRQPIYRVEGVGRHRSYFTYAAKAHPSVSPPGELLISYVINSHDFWTMAADAEIYRPRFIRLALDEVAAGGAP